MRSIKLNQFGFDHVVGVVVFVVLFGLVGSALVLTHAQTPDVQLRLNNNNACFNGFALQTPCNTTNAETAFVQMTGSNFQIKNADGYCVDDWNAGIQENPQTDTSAPDHTRVQARLNTCYKSGTDPNQEWNWNGHELVNEASKGCLNAAGATDANSTPVVIYSCKGNPWNENWEEVSVTSKVAKTTSPIWGLAGTTIEQGSPTYSSSTDRVTIGFSSTVKNLGPDTSGTFSYGPRYFYSSTASPTLGSNGYAGETATVVSKTGSSLKDGASITGITQSVTVPSNETSTYLCGTVAFSPYNNSGDKNGRSPALCVNISQQRTAAMDNK